MVTRSISAAFPIAAICCLGLILFAITVTIILALIPVYLLQKSATFGPINSMQDIFRSNTPVRGGGASSS
jgi:hypothetical protein